jgi:hypothetical protein
MHIYKSIWIISSILKLVKSQDKCWPNICQANLGTQTATCQLGGPTGCECVISSRTGGTPGIAESSASACTGCKGADGTTCGTIPLPPAIPPAFPQPPTISLSFTKILTVTTNSPGPTSNNINDNVDLGTGKIVGIVAGSIGFLTLITVATIFFIRRKRSFPREERIFAEQSSPAVLN